MSITFEPEADIILWTLGKLLVTFEERSYLFAAQCIWWIAALVQLDPSLRYFIDHRRFPLSVTDDNTGRESQLTERGVSSTPQDIQRHSETYENMVPVENQYQADPLQRTQKGRVDPIPKTKRQLKAERKRQL